MKEKYYAGIGSRETPEDVLNLMSKIAGHLATEGYTLKSGGADGADLAFERGCDAVGGKKKIYLPWKGFNNNKSDLYVIPDEAFHIAEKFHPAWDKLGRSARRLMARNVMQVLEDFRDPAEFVICWTKNGKAMGGTGQAIRIADYYKIPIYNLKNDSDIERLKDDGIWPG